MRGDGWRRWLHGGSGTWGRRGLALASVALIVAVIGGGSGWLLASRSARRVSVARTPVVTATPDTRVRPGSFAFVRGGQVYVARRGYPARQVTHFVRPDTDPTHWGPLAWAPDNGHLAVVVGSPVVARDQLATAAGTLYVVDAQSGASVVVVPVRGIAAGVAVGPAAYAWRDAGTLLFAAAGRMYAYALATGQATPVSGLAATVLELEVRGHTVYYASYRQPSGPFLVVSVALRRHDLVSNADTAVEDLGSAVMQVTGCGAVGCEAAVGVPVMAPAWDVSADEGRIAFERISSVTPDRTRASASFWYAARTEAAGTETAGTETAGTETAGTETATLGAPQRIFAGVAATLPAGAPGTCCYLRFAPDGQGLVLSSGYAMPASFGPYLLYTHELARGWQVGYPWAFGPAAWAPDATAFVLVAHWRAAPTTSLLIYGNQGTAPMEDDAYSCAWAAGSVGA